METVADIVLTIWVTLMLAGAFVKSKAWFASVRWALKYGAPYSAEIQSAPTGLTTAARMHKIAQPWYDDGGAWPGAKSVKIWTENPTGWRRGRDLLFLKTPCFLAEVALFCWSAGAVATPPWTIRFSAMFLATWLSLYALALIIEAIIWYFIAHNYGLVWGDIKFASSSTSTATRALGDIKGLLAVIITAIASSIVLVLATSEIKGGYSGIRSSDDWSFTWDSTVSSVYFVLVNATTVGDDSIAPIGTAGRLSAAILHLTVLLVIGVALTAVASRVNDRA